MTVVFRTDDLPAAERFDVWQEITTRLWVPVETHIDQDTPFRVEFRAAVLGGMNVFTAACPSFELRRTPRLIRQSDPELYVLVRGRRGLCRVSQEQREVTIGPADLTLYDTSRPFSGWTGPDGRQTHLVAVAFPRALLPLHPDAVRRLTAVRLPGRTGIGALISALVTQLGEHAATCPPAEAARLSTGTLELLAALLSQELDDSHAPPPESRKRALLHQIHTFIQRRLGDPALSPDDIAAANHISTRYLHRLFQEQGMTVAGWIRDRRLDRCRRDLADPAWASWSVSAIATRWGLGTSSHFSRVFRAAYGLSPKEYRQLHSALSQRAG